MSYCSPKKGNREGQTCIDIDLSNKIIDEFKQTFPSVKIDDKLPINKKLQIILKSFKDETGGCVDNDYCLLKVNRFKKYKDDLEASFRPPVPADWKNKRNTWLNTNDIYNSLKQYEDNFREFKLISVSPIDFDTILRRSFYNSRANIDSRKNNSSSGGECVDQNLCTLNLKTQRKDRKTKIGAVFNLDKHYQSGSHWVAFYTDLTLGEIYYYDSVAQQPPNEVIALSERLIEQGNKLVSDNELQINETNRFSFDLKMLSKNKIILPLDRLINWMLKGYNFTNNRFSNYRSNEVLSKNNFRFKIEKNDELVKSVLDSIFRLVDKTQQYRYIRIPSLSRLLHTNKSNLDGFAHNWVYENVQMAINNYLASLKLLKVGDKIYQIKTINSDNKTGNIVITLTKDVVEGNNTRVVDISFKSYKNYIQHQFKNTECGMYSINFIDSFLTKNMSFSEIINTPINDESMNSLRYSKYYRPE